MTEEAEDRRDDELEQLREYYRSRDPEFDARVELAQTMARLVDLRRVAGLTQVQVAERMGVPQSTVARLESGTTDPRVSTVKNYVRAVGRQLVAEVENAGISRVSEAAPSYSKDKAVYGTGYSKSKWYSTLREDFAYHLVDTMPTPMKPWFSWFSLRRHSTVSPSTLHPKDEAAAETFLHNGVVI